MRLNVLLGPPAGASALIGLAEITLLVMVAVVAYWLVHAMRRAERAWWEHCTRPPGAIPARRGAAPHGPGASHGAAGRPMPQDQPIAAVRAQRDSDTGIAWQPYERGPGDNQHQDGEVDRAA